MCLVLALVLCVGAALDLAAPKKAPEAPAPTAYPSQPERVLALLGDAQDSWCAPLFDEIRPWAADQGWRLVHYDCAGSVQTQRGQLDDLLRTQAPEAVILYDLGDGDWRAEAVERLEKAGVQVVTLSRWGEADVGPAPEELWSAAMEGLEGGALLLTDLPDDPALSAAQAALGDRLLGNGACWATPAYAADYLAQALPLCPQTAAVLCLSREGALGAKNYVETRGLSVRVLALDPSPETAEDLALGRIDAVAEVSREGLLDALAQALAGKKPEPLTVTLRTSQS